MPYAHICPEHGVEACPNMTIINGGKHVCERDSKLKFDSELFYTDIPVNVG